MKLFKRVKRPVGAEFTSVVKPKSKSKAIWVGRLMMLAGIVDQTLQVTGNGEMLKPYLGESGGAIIGILGVVNNIIRSQTTTAIR